MKIMFMGTPEFAVTALESLIESKHEVTAVVSRSDKPKGRGHIMLPPPVKECAQKHGIEVYQPETLKDNAFMPVLEKVNPDIIIVAAYGKILPEYVLNYPKFGCVNIHASSLPEYRGAAPIQRCIMDGKEKTGVTIMYMAKGLDTGDMLLKEEIKIGNDETADSLHDRLAVLGGELICKALEKMENGTLKREVQDDSLATYADKIDKSTALIDWSRSNTEIKNLVRAMNSWPLACTYYNGKMMKIAVCDVCEDNSDKKCGTILEHIKGEGLKIKCGSGAIMVKQVKFEGKKLMDTDDYIRGNGIEIGVVLGRK